MALAAAIWLGKPSRRRGRLLDARTTRFQTLTFVMSLLPVVILPTLLGQHRPLRHLIIAGVFIAVWGFLYLYLDNAYQNRRLKSGDFDPNSLV